MRIRAKVLSVVLVTLLIPLIACTPSSETPPSSSGNIVFRLGGEAADYGKDIAVDDAGNIYVAGYFQGTVDFDPGTGTVNRTAIGDPNDPVAGAGRVDIFLAKYDAGANFQWVISIGGQGADMPHSVQVDKSGNIFMTGYFSGQVDFDPSDESFILDAGVGRNIFLAKYSSNGELLWAKGLGDEEPSATDENTREEGMDIALDQQGNVYLIADFNGILDVEPEDGPDNLDTFTSRNNSVDMIVASYDNSGTYRWGFAIGGDDRDGGHAIDVGNDGCVVIAGFFSLVVDFDPDQVGVSNLTSWGGWDVFFAKYGQDGEFLWAKSFGGSANDQVRPGGICIDDSDNIYLTGDFGTTTDFDPGSNTANLTSNGSGDIFIAKYDASGNYIWAIGMGGTALDGGHRVAVDSSDNVYLAGWFRQTADFDPGPGQKILTAAATGGASDIILAKYDKDGKYLWANQFGAPVTTAEEWSLAAGLAMDKAGNIFATGRFYKTADFDPGSGVLNLMSAGDADVFVAKYRADGSLYE